MSGSYAFLRRVACRPPYWFGRVIAGAGWHAFWLWLTLFFLVYGFQVENTISAKIAIPILWSTGCEPPHWFLQFVEFDWRLVRRWLVFFPAIETSQTLFGISPSQCILQLRRMVVSKTTTSWHVSKDKYYFSRIQLFDSDEIVTPSLKRKIDRKKRKKLEKLERNGILIGKDATKLLRKAKKFELKNEDDPSQILRRKWSIAMLRAQGSSDCTHSFA